MSRRNKQGIIVLSALEEDILTVIFANTELYGAEIIERIGQSRRVYGMSELECGSVYPTLRRLEKDGLLKSEWRDIVCEEKKHCCRYYWLSLQGSEAIVTAQEYRQHLMRSLSQINQDTTPSLPRIPDFQGDSKGLQEQNSCVM